MLNLETFYNWILPLSFGNKSDLYGKAKNLIRVHLLALLWMAMAAGFWQPVRVNLLPVFIFALLGYGFSLWCFKRYNSFQVSGNIFLTISFFCFLGTVYFFQMSFFPFLIWFFFFPIFAWTFCGKRSAIFWLVLGLGCIVWAFLYTPFEIPSYYKSWQVSIIFILNPIFFFLFMAFFQIMSDNEKKKLFEQLSLEREQSKTLIENIPVGVAYINKDLKVEYINPIIERFAKTKSKFARGQRLDDLLAQERFEMVKPYYDRALKGKVSSFERYYDPPGRPRMYIRSFYVPLTDPSKNVIGFIVLIEDLSSIKKKPRKPGWRWKKPNRKNWRKPLISAIGN